MKTLRIVRREEPTGNIIFVIQKLCRTGLFFQKRIWKDCSSWDLTFSDDEIDKYLWKHPRTNKFTSSTYAKKCFCYFDGSQTIETEVYKGEKA